MREETARTEEGAARYRPTHTWREWRTAESAGSESNLYACMVCGSVVAHETTSLHDVWHLRMDGHHV